jgi:proline dehydrogenase
MIRQVLSTVAGQPWLRKAVISTPGVRDIAWRFVAGENLDAGIAVVRKLNARRIKGTLNFIGTHVTDEAEAILATDANIEALQRVREESLDSNLSIKLTQIGLDIDASFCRSQLRRILAAASQFGNFVRIDMEESSYVDITLKIFDEMQEQFGPETVGIVLQSYLRQRRDDLPRLVEAGSSIRLVKGGYWESSETVYRRKADIDNAFRHDIALLLEQGRYPAVATHDARFIHYIRQFSAKTNLSPRTFEFQMLYGVRSDLQKSLVQDGFTVRCYVPYGGNWYSYTLGCVRRIPAGILERCRADLRWRGIQ